jgi:hypothetical protein
MQMTMSAIRWILPVVCLAIWITGCAATPHAASQSEELDVETITLPVRTPFRLNDLELQRAKRLALVGDLPASYCIANHYAFEADAKDPDRSFWILIAAENGDAGAMTMISEIYRTGRDARLHDRSEFWRLRAEATRSQEHIDCHARVS